MKATTDLYDLVKSMTKSEMIRFKISCGAEDQIYLKLFDGMCAQETYNEAALKKLLYKELKTAKFAVLKKYLFDRIARFLSVYYEEYDAYFTMTRHLKMAQIYHDKQLLELCNKELIKAETLAEANHCYTELLVIYKLKEKVIRGLQTPSDYATLHQAFVDKEQTMLEHHLNLATYRRLDSEFILALHKLSDITNADALSEIKQLQNHPYLQDATIPSTVVAKFFFYAINGSISNLLGDLETGLTYRTQCLQLLEEHPFEGAEYNRFYAVTLHNYLKNLRTLHYWERFKIAYIKVDDFVNAKYDEVDHRTKMFLFTIIVLNKPDEIILSGSIVEFKQFLKFFDAEMSRHRTHLDASYVAFFHVSVIYNCIRFGLNEKAFEYINKMQTLGMDKHLDKLYDKVFRLFILLVHFELKNFRLLRNLANTHLRYLQRSGRPTKFERALIKFFRGISFSTTDLQYLKTELQAIELIPEEKFQFEYLQIIPWIDHLIEKQPFYLILRETQLATHTENNY